LKEETTVKKRLPGKLENFFDGQFEPDWKNKIGY
jgi:hypothetical protein